MSARGPVWVLFPVKSFASAKSRLAGVLAPAERARFARELFEHVLGEALAAPSIAGVAVVTAGDDVASLARSRGALVLPEIGAPSLAAIVDGGLAALGARGASVALVLMSDLPNLGRAEVAALAGALEHHDVVASPDHGGAGTGALGLAPPGALRTCFGTKGSFALHRDRALAAGLRFGVLESPGLAFDIDEPSDLTRLRSL